MGIEWYALLLPLLGAVILYLGWKKYLVWWELLLPIVATALIITIFKLSANTVLTRDVEYRGAPIVSARYYEYWDTWVEQTCSYECCCDSKGNNCQTIYYDCSYCSHHDPEWIAYDAYGKGYSISEAHYNKLMKRWNSIPKFVELNRSINHSGGCGTDGDAYDIFWDHQPETGEAAVWTMSYVNKVQASKSAFQYPEIKKKEAEKIGLYEYPLFFENYRQDAILGVDSIYKGRKLDSIKRLFEYMNGYVGKKHHCKTFTLLFYDKPIDIAFKQEAYWSGGNDNEVVVCIGLKKDKSIDWVKAFTWCDNKKCLVDIREDVAELNYFEPNSVAYIISKYVAGAYTPKNFDDFNYLQVELPTSIIIAIYLVSLCVTIGLCYWSVKNDINN
jgi:hypothetical protein